MKRIAKVIWVVVAAVTSIGGIRTVFGQGEGVADFDLYELGLKELTELKVTTPSRHSEGIQESTSDITVISGNELREYGVRSIHDALRRVPGFYASLQNSGTIRASYRGSDAVSMLIMLDGHVLNEPETGSAIYSFADQIPIEMIERIEFVKGPGSSLYGANAFLGVVNIITRDDDKESFAEVSARVEVDREGVIGTIGNYGLMKPLENKGHMWLNFQYLDYSGPNVLVESDTLGQSGRSNAGREQYDFQLGLDFDRLTFSSRIFQRKGEGHWGVFYALAEGTLLNTLGGHIELESILIDSSDLKLNAVAYLDHVKLDNYFVGYAAGTLPEGHRYSAWNDTGFVGNPKLNKTSGGFELRSTYFGLGRHTFVSGMGYRYESQHDAAYFANFSPGPLPEVVDVSDGFNWMENAHRDIFSFYFEDTFQLSERFRIDAGARLDEYSDFGTTLNPRGGMSLKVREGMYMKSSYGTGFRAPNFGLQFVKNNPAFIGNPDLKPEEIETLDLRFDCSISDSISGSLSGFQSSLSNKIRAVKRGIGKNLGQSDIKGWELASTWKFSKELYARGGVATHKQVEYLGSSSRSSSGKTANLFFGWRYWGEDTFSVEAYWREVPEADRKPETGDHFMIWDATLNIVSLRDHVDLSISAHNLFDESYWYPGESGEKFRAQGRSISIGLKWEL